LTPSITQFTLALIAPTTTDTLAPLSVCCLHVAKTFNRKNTNNTNELIMNLSVECNCS
jgi:hypothetical protein